MKSILHAAVCVVLALATSWFTTEIWAFRHFFNNPFHPGGLTIVACALGALHSLLCALYCILIPKRNKCLPKWMLFAPLFAVLVAALTPLTAMGQFAPGLEMAHPDYRSHAIFVAIALVSRDMGLALLWAATGFFSIAFTAGTLPLPAPPPAVNKSRTMLFQRLALGLGLLIFGHILLTIFRELFVVSWKHFLVLEQYVPTLWIEFFMALLLIDSSRSSAIFWLYLRAPCNSLMHSPFNRAAGITSAALLGGTITFSMAFLSLIGSTAVAHDLTQYGSKFMLISWWGRFQHMLYHRSWPILIAFAPAGALLAGLILYPMRRNLRVWVGPTALTLALILTAALTPIRLAQHLERTIEPEEQTACHNLPQSLEILQRFRMSQHFSSKWSPRFIWVDKTLWLPTTTAKGDRLWDAVVIGASKEAIFVQGDPVVALNNGWSAIDEINAGDELLLPNLLSALEERAEHLRMLASRTNDDREWMALLAMDKDTPLATVYQVVHTASQANFTDLKFVVTTIDTEAIEYNLSTPSFPVPICPTFMTLDVKDVIPDIPASERPEIAVQNDKSLQSIFP